MLMAGVAGWDTKMQTVNMISTILASAGKKVSAIDLCSLAELDIKHIKSYLYELDKNNTDVFILKINVEDLALELLELFHFDIIMYTGRIGRLDSFASRAESQLFEILLTAKTEKNILILNADDIDVILFLRNGKSGILTYGFNSRSDITASSIGDMLSENGFLCCLQKPIYSRDGFIIEPQEYRVDIELKDIDAYSVLAAASFAIAAGINLNYLNYAGVKA